jgi:hypothetical protein
VTIYILFAAAEKWSQINNQCCPACPAEKQISLASIYSNKPNVGAYGGNHTNEFTAVLKRIHWY